MKKTLLATTMLVAIAVSTTASHAFTWSNLNPFTWGSSSKCEKVCKKDCCDPCKAKPKCKKDKCDPCKKDKCNCKPKCECEPKCDPCDKKAETCAPCQPCNPCQKAIAPCDPCKPMPECNACDKLQQATER